MHGLGWLVFGIFIGNFLGLLTAALCVAASNSDRPEAWDELEHKS